MIEKKLSIDSYVKVKGDISYYLESEKVITRELSDTESNISRHVDNGGTEIVYEYTYNECDTLKEALIEDLQADLYGYYGVDDDNSSLGTYIDTFEELVEYVYEKALQGHKCSVSSTMGDPLTKEQKDFISKIIEKYLKR